jgi:hypothetical protein
MITDTNKISEYVLMKAGLIASLSLVLYLVIIMPTEYFLTEHWLVVPAITPQQKTWLLLGCFIVVFSVIQLLRKNTVTYQTLILPLIILLLTLTGNFFYDRHYQELQKYPRIFNISSNWSIQGMPIKITGKNFGHDWQAGSVRVEELEFTNHRWSDTEILVKQPVPEKYFKGELVVENARGNISEGWPFEIRDPDTLHK